MLLKTLTPTQLELLNQSAPVLSAVDAVDFTSTAAAPIDGPWYATGHASATATEVLGMAVLLAIYFERKSSDRNEARRKLLKWQELVSRPMQHASKIWAACGPHSRTLRLGLSTARS